MPQNVIFARYLKFALFLQRGRRPLYLAVEGGHTGTVGVLLDFMHSVDTRVSGIFTPCWRSNAKFMQLRRAPN